MWSIVFNRALYENSVLLYFEIWKRVAKLKVTKQIMVLFFFFCPWKFVKNYDLCLLIHMLKSVAPLGTFFYDVKKLSLSAYVCVDVHVFMSTSFRWISGRLCCNYRMKICFPNVLEKLKMSLKIVFHEIAI
jgi:hypothetical protein